MNHKTKKEELKFDCQLKAKNLKTALDSVINNDFQSFFLLENFIKCKKESIASIEKLIEHMELDGKRNSF
ncbi:MAG: hypothetical protein P0Y49_16580 [Candidatus Pedobacter colombiensis]|uniref:Uncharacterized protein n=1 Tax=Candidatus Pedobacter colombiensis TaxID=3121371 RepID=A0AAJ6B565_9SPHI|nr:hypothetical protein [Pedobacter sp.]WEK18407.1 MAG: hypothetical protein P0Y49_16580 [Pedobacter sp.]